MPVKRKTIYLTVQGDNTLTAADESGAPSADGGVQGENSAVWLHADVPDEWKDLTVRLRVTALNGNFDESTEAVGGAVEMPLRQGVCCPGRLTVTLIGFTADGSGGYNIRKTADCKTLRILPGTGGTNAVAQMIPIDFESLLDEVRARCIHTLTGSGGAVVTQKSGTQWQIDVSGTGGDMAKANYAQGSGRLNPNTVDKALFAQSIEGQAAAYGLSPGSDSTDTLNAYFDAVGAGSSRYADLNVSGMFAAQGPLAGARKVLKSGAAQIGRSNPDNWFVGVSKSRRSFIGRLNHRPKAGFPRFQQALSADLNLLHPVIGAGSAAGVEYIVNPDGSVLLNGTSTSQLSLQLYPDLKVGSVGANDPPALNTVAGAPYVYSIQALSGTASGSFNVSAFCQTSTVVNGVSPQLFYASGQPISSFWIIVPAGVTFAYYRFRPRFETGTVPNAAINTKICFIGDSITAAGGTHATLGLHAPVFLQLSGPNSITGGDSYPMRLMQFLLEAYPDRDFDYFNYALPGELIQNWQASRTFDGVTQNWIDFCKGAAPDLLIIGFGMNNDTFDSARQVSFAAQALLRYIRLNFRPVPDVVFVTAPRPTYTPGEASFGTFEAQAARMAAANALCAVAKENRCYVCDAARLSDIRRIGLDYARPILRKSSPADCRFTQNGTPTAGPSFSLSAGDTLGIGGTFYKDFDLILTINLPLSLAASAANALTVQFNAPVLSDNRNNSCIIHPKNASGVGDIISYLHIANYAQYGNYKTAAAVDTAAYATGNDVTLEIAKRGSAVEYRVDGVLKLRDTAQCWDCPGMFQLLTNFPITIKSVELCGAEYPDYLPELLDDEVFGPFASGDYGTKALYGGNGANHPSTIGLENCYVPCLKELVEDL